MRLRTRCWVSTISFRPRTRAGPYWRSRLIRREARRALELDPFETDPHFLLGAVAAVHDYDWPEAARQFQLAMVSPSVPAEAHWAYASLYLGLFGRFEESTAEKRRAVEQDPLDVNWRGVLMAHLVCAGRCRGGPPRRTKGAGHRAERDSPTSGPRRSLPGLGEDRRSRRRRGESASELPAALHGHGIPCRFFGPAGRKGAGRGTPPGNG